MSNIRDIEGVIRGMWDWGFINEAFAPTKIRTSDIDGIVERRGYFLILEGKPLGATLAQGQEIMLRKLADTPRFTVILVEGEAPNTVWRLTDIGRNRSWDADNAELVATCRRWFELVEKG